MQTSGIRHPASGRLQSLIPRGVRPRVTWVALSIVMAGCGARVGQPGETFDFGPVFAADTPSLEHEFRVVNTTGRPVKLLSEMHSCTCTDVAIKFGVLQPGESTPLRLKVSIPDGRVDRVVGCTIKTDDPKHPDWLYSIAAQAYTAGRIDPDRIAVGTASLDPDVPSVGGTTTEALATTAWVELFDRGEGPPPAAKLVDVPGELTSKLDDRGEIDRPAKGIRRVRYRLTVGLRNRPTVEGSFAATIGLMAGGKPLQAVVVWSTKGLLSVAPSTVHFGFVGGGDTPKSVAVMVRSVDGRAFRLVDSPADSGPVTIRRKPRDHPDNPEAPLSIHHVELVFDPSRRGSGAALNGVASIKTDLPGVATCPVKWSAFSRGPVGPPADVSSATKPNTGGSER